MKGIPDYALRATLIALLVISSGCDDDPSGPVDPPDPMMMSVLGLGPIADRYTAEVSVRGGFAYTSTWGTRLRAGVSTPGNTVYIWNVAGAVPQLVDSVAVPAALTVGDVQVTDDGQHLIVCTEPGPGSVVIYSLADPRRPLQIAVFTSPRITSGVHTAQVSRVAGRLYAFLSVNRGASHPSRVMIVDLANPAQPVEVKTIDVTGSFNHDVFVRDGLLFTAQWDNGVVIFDIGGGSRGGSPAGPVQISVAPTIGGNAHNLWWFHDPTTGSRRYAFVGEEGPASLLSSSSGDIHVIDLSNMAEPREVAFFRVPGAGAHNFAVDEAQGLLYAAYYNGGVQVLDIRGDLGSCPQSQKAPDGRCDLRLMGRSKAVGLLDRSPVFIWGVELSGNAVYAADMANGLWKLAAVSR
ncbi:MAG: LVIVD repeat-containing protein [Gemmatimonadota bacterium]